MNNWKTFILNENVNIDIHDLDCNGGKIQECHDLVLKYIKQLGFTGFNDQQSLEAVETITLTKEDTNKLRALFKDRSVARYQGASFTNHKLALYISKICNELYGIEIVFNIKNVIKDKIRTKIPKNYKLNIQPIVKDYLIFNFNEIIHNKFNIKDDVFCKSDIHDYKNKLGDYVEKIKPKKVCEFISDDDEEADYMKELDNGIDELGLYEINCK
jgi:hypothetical protein